MAGKWTLLLATVVLGNSTVFGGGVKCLREMGPRGLDIAADGVPQSRSQTGLCRQC